MEDYTEHFPENCQSWPNPNNIQVLFTFCHWIEDSILQYFTESFSENLIKHPEYWDKPGFKKEYLKFKIPENYYFQIVTLNVSQQSWVQNSEL